MVTEPEREQLSTGRSVRLEKQKMCARVNGQMRGGYDL